MLPADTSCRINPQKGCKLQSKSWAGGTKRFHSHISFFLAQCSVCSRENQEARGVVLSFWFGLVWFLNFLKVELLAKYPTDALYIMLGVSGYITAC